MQEIEFLNIDLDLESNDDLSLIVEAFADECSVLRNEIVDGCHYLSFETGYSEENEIIEKYVSLINGLNSEGSALWDKCKKREFNFGYSSGKQPNHYCSTISASSIKALSEVGGSVVVTIYPEWSKAFNE